MRRKQNAFTLIELLVVISIIALLISILMPALASAKKQARFVICQSNLKQLQLGMIYYKDEYEDKLIPYFINPGKPGEDQICWIQWIDLQVDRVDEVRVCPETSTEGWEGRANVFVPAQTPKEVWIAGFLPIDKKEVSTFEQNFQYGSYTMNGWFYIIGKPDWYWGDPINDHYFRKYGNIKRPSETPCFSDANWLDHWPFELPAGTAFPTNVNLQTGNVNDSSYFGRLLIDRHNCRINHSFADGHVGPSTLPDLWTLNWYNGYIPRYNAPDYENLY